MTFEEADAKYPYDPSVQSSWLVGIAKLRAFDDPKMRRSVFELWNNVGGVAPIADPTAGRYG